MIWILILVAILIVVLAIVAIINTKKGKKHKTDYYALFIMGVTWFPFGIIMWFVDRDGTIWNIFTILGFIYLVMGLTHKKEWKKNHIPFNKLPKKEQKIKIVIITALGIFVLLGLVVFYFLNI